jgi:hypothetical protein
MSESGIFKIAGKLTPDQRAAYLHQACASDGELRAEVHSLLIMELARGQSITDYCDKNELDTRAVGAVRDRVRRGPARASKRDHFRVKIIASDKQLACARKPLSDNRICDGENNQRK